MTNRSIRMTDWQKAQRKFMKGQYTEPDILKFKKEEVQAAIDYSIKNPRDTGDWYNGFDLPSMNEFKEKASTTPTLIIVGDEGVYFMAGGKIEDDHPIAYAEGCNPKVDEFDDWWAKKGSTWGGDDGSDPVQVSEIQGILDKCKTHLIVAFEEKSFTIMPDV